MNFKSMLLFSVVTLALTNSAFADKTTASAPNTKSHAIAAHNDPDMKIGGRNTLPPFRNQTFTSHTGDTVQIEVFQMPGKPAEPNSLTSVTITLSNGAQLKIQFRYDGPLIKFDVQKDVHEKYKAQQKDEDKKTAEEIKRIQALNRLREKQTKQNS